MVQNQNPRFKRPKRLPNARRYVVILPQEDAEAFDALLGYYADIIGVKLSLSGVMRTALREMKERLDRDFVRVLVEGPRDSLAEFEELRAAERRKALEANYMKIDGGETKCGSD